MSSPRRRGSSGAKHQDDSTFLILSFASLIFLSGCVGTFMKDSKVDTSKPFPSLHEVPDRPPEKDIKKLQKELDALKNVNAGRIK